MTGYKLTVVIWMALAVNISHVTAQEGADFWAKTLAQQPKQFSYFLNFSGGLVFRQYPDIEAESFDPIWYYDHPTILAELKLENDAKRKIESAFEKWHEELIEVIRDQSVDEPDKSSSDRKDKPQHDPGNSNQRLVKINKNLDRRIKSALTDKQFRRLRQMQFRFLVNSNGFYQWLNQPAVRDEFKISPLPSDSLRRIQSKIARQLFDDSRKSVQHAVDRWLEDLSEDQRKHFDREWKKILDKREYAISQQLVLQLDFDEYKSTENDDDPFLVYSKWPGYLADVDGSISKRAYDKPIKIPEQLFKFRTITGLLRSSFIKQKLEMIDEQSSSIERLLKEYQDSKWEINRRLGEEAGVVPRMIGTPENRRAVYNFADQPKVMAEFNKQLDRLAAPYVDKMLDTLLPHQKKLLRTTVRQIVLRYQGPLAEIMHGDLGVKMQLTDAEKRSLKQKAREAREFLMKESRRLTQEALDQLLDAVPKNDRDRLARLLGPPPQHGFVNLDAFVVVLLRPSRNE